MSLFDTSPDCPRHFGLVDGELVAPADVLPPAEAVGERADVLPPAEAVERRADMLPPAEAVGERADVLPPAEAVERRADVLSPAEAVGERAVGERAVGGRAVGGRAAESSGAARLAYKREVFADGELVAEWPVPEGFPAYTRYALVEDLTWTAPDGATRPWSYEDWPQVGARGRAAALSRATGRRVLVAVVTRERS